MKTTAIHLLVCSILVILGTWVISSFSFINELLKIVKHGSEGVDIYDLPIKAKADKTMMERIGIYSNSCRHQLC